MIMWMSIIGSVKWYEVPSLKSYMQGRLAIRNNYFKGSHKPYNCLILLFYPLGRSRQFPSCLIIRFCFKIILRANVCPPKVRSFLLVFQQLKLLRVNPRENLPLWDVKPRGKTRDFLLRACAHSWNSSVCGLVYLRRKLRSVMQICHRISHESMRKHWTKSFMNFAKWCDSTKYPDILPRPAPSHRGSRNRSQRSLNNLRIWRRVRIKLSNYLHKKALWRRKERKSQSILNSNLNRRPCDVLCSLDTVVTTSSKCRNTQNLSRWKDKLLFAFMHGKCIVCHFLPSFPLFCCGQSY